MSQKRTNKNTITPQSATSGLAVSAWNRGVARFQYLPIRLKLMVIIGTIVVSVIFSFSLFVIKNQEDTLMDRMDQVCKVLIETLSDAAKDGLLLKKTEQIPEAVHTLKNNAIQGLNKVAIISSNPRRVIGVDADGEFIPEDSAAVYFQFLESNVFRKSETKTEFIFSKPIIQKSRKNDRLESVKLGVAYISFVKEDILAPTIRARKIAVVATIVIVIFALIFINLIARKMAKQIQLLSEGARQVGRGNLNVEILPGSNDELGLLATEFNNMIQLLREKMQMQKFVSKLTVDMIKDSGQDFNQNKGAIKRSVVVLFSDVRSFSSVAENLDPGEIVKLINVYFDIQTRIVERHKGVVDKFMGDQIMAIFQGKNMADNALRAAVEIQKQVKIINQERQAQNKIMLEMGVGINSGAAVMGNMGSSDRMDYTVIGDVVNVAARLCGVATAGQIITSYEVAKRVNGSYPTSRQKSISVKGRKQAIEICEVDYDLDIII